MSICPRALDEDALSNASEASGHSATVENSVECLPRSSLVEVRIVTMDAATLFVIFISATGAHYVAYSRL